ncbi:protein mobD [Acetobacter cerevisiae]|uniref:Protein mobD n=1 Tax=Acetobacter cerevisiae TaxID=178900 RepID=A0A149UTN2_9PROT|nr:P-loop NTPase [Acetobacter cerevisiae]KXV71288.1 protein mobD [Acetobacter cerevisiae]KXV78665.1 protein mobD [Acetobacter cerevisiae]
MESIYLVGGGKGGVGKSMVSMSLIDFLMSEGKDVLLVETDTSNPDVMKCYQSEIAAVALNLDHVDGWMDLITQCDNHRNHVVVINSAARNDHAVQMYGDRLQQALPLLTRKLITFWVINRQRDCIELLRNFLDQIPESKTNVLMNAYFGNREKFETYNNSQTKKYIEQLGGKSLIFPELADRVADDLYINRMTIEKAAEDLPIGNRIELLRWRAEVKKMFEEVIE